MLTIGTTVKITGLQSNSAKQLNGKTGMITSALDNETGRYGVKPHGMNKALAIKPTNLVEIKKAKTAANNKYAEYTLSLTAGQWEWLDSMAKKHSLSSPDKALRCCLDCIFVDDINMAECPIEFFKGDRVEKTVQLYPDQKTWLEKWASGCDGTSPPTLVRSCEEADENVVFGVIRCRTKISQCDEAMEALNRIKGQNKGKEVEVREDIDILAKWSRIFRE